MTVDFDPFWTIKMFGDPLLHIGDPQNLSLVTPLVTTDDGHQGSQKKPCVPVLWCVNSLNFFKRL